MKISWIEPHMLAASGIPLDAKDIHALHAQGIRAILTLTEQPLFIQREITPALLNTLDICALHTPIRDQHPPSPAQAEHILAQIQAMHVQQRPMLVHCHAGIGRTGTILHLYYLAQGMSLPAARAQIRRTRIQSILLSAAQEAFLQTYTTPADAAPSEKPTEIPNSPVVSWQQIADPTSYVRQICAREAPDIPQSLLAGIWQQETISINTIQPDEALLIAHDADRQHNQRRDYWITCIQQGGRVPPMIILRCSRGTHYLIDGYARFRALRSLGIIAVQVLRQK